jgi:hypothetical protein
MADNLKKRKRDAATFSVDQYHEIRARAHSLGCTEREICMAWEIAQNTMRGGGKKPANLRAVLKRVDSWIDDTQRNNPKMTITRASVRLAGKQP